MRDNERLASGGGWITGHHDARWDFRGTGPDRTLAAHADTGSGWQVLMTSHVQQFTLNYGEKFKQWLGDLSKVTDKNKGLVGFGPGPVLGPGHPLIIVRHPSRSDDSRTLIAAALPEAGIVHNKGYVHAVAVEPGTEENAVLALLGFLNTPIADWWARRFVDRHVTAPVVNQMALPEWTPDQVETAASYTGSLLARRGYNRLAGGVVVADGHPSTSDG
ncbi:MAG: hypothetical protein H7290_04140, partial [Flavobacterium sp.]|nr:hypothetical protein [Aeromicrobium sp.]